MSLAKTAIIMFCFCSYTTMPQARPVCVDANTKQDAQNGSCWQHPFKQLQQALDAAENDSTIDEIWLTEGVYHPTKTYAPPDHQNIPVPAGAFSRAENNPGITAWQQLIRYDQHPAKHHFYLRTFRLIDGVSLYGGFVGNERSRTARDLNPFKHRTIIDGQINKQAVWHVMTAGNDMTGEGVTLTLDRLTIRGGNALQAPYFPHHFPLKASEVPIYYHDDGGGLYIFMRSHITLNHVVFEHNQAVAGGAIFAQDGSQLILTHCIFKNNYALNGAVMNIRLGGPHEFISSMPRKTIVRLHNNQFINNHSQFGANIFTNDNQTAHPPISAF